jgi:transposase
MPKLKREEVVTLNVLKEKGQSQSAIARTLGVTEGAVRYHVRRRRQGATDGRSEKRFKAEAVDPAIEFWFQTHGGVGESAGRPASVLALYEWLASEHGYQGSYQSVLRYIRVKYPRPRLRPYRRVETPAGAMAQVDWGEFSIDVGDGPQKLYGFVLVLCHSRKEVVIWSRRMDQLSWHRCHNEALRRIEGVPAVIRIDNLKTGVGRGAGPWGELNPAYRSYARAVGFHIDPCLPRSPEHKGKVENKVGAIRRRLAVEQRCFDSQAELQRYSDEQLEAWDRRRRCPATGESVEASWRAEQAALRPLPLLPEVFDVAVTRPVHRDCTVQFEDRTYSVPFVLCGLLVEVRGCAESIQIVHDGRLVAEHPRGTAERIVLDPSHYEGSGDERVAPPTPLGRLGRRLGQILAQPVEQRPLDLYATLAEVAR